jgi:hypothetical protein
MNTPAVGTQAGNYEQGITNKEPWIQEKRGNFSFPENDRHYFTPNSIFIIPCWVLDIL